MQRSEKDDDSLWWLIIIIIMLASASDSVPQAVRRPDTSQAAARAIFARHDSASGRVGGRSSLRYSHTVSEIESAAGKTISEVWVATPNRVLTRITMQGAGTTMEVGYDGKIGWTNSPMMGPVLIEGEPLMQLAKQAQGRGQTDATFKTLTVGANTHIEGRDVVPVAFDDGDGGAGTLYFDAKTGLLHALRVKDAGDPNVLTLFTDYKRIDGELFAMTTTSNIAGHSLVTRTTHIDHRVIDTALFVPPLAVRSLLKKP